MADTLTEGRRAPTVAAGTKPVRPRHAASLLLVDRSGPEPKVLMGRRAPRNKFAPDIFVFPGGKLDPADRAMTPGTPLRPDVAQRLGPMGTALALAAVRETFEETGLLIGVAAPAHPVPSPSWAAFTASGLAPALDGIDILARAITPTDSPMRFHARFLVADSANVQGSLGDSHELLDLGFRTIDESLRLPVWDVTEFMLAELRSYLNSGSSTFPRLSYRKGRADIRRAP
ncbi:NUDIX hydrolase [Zavarzinia sp. CC-PAN008]|uniref:NUDIX hydrolase n=1 Tax=Zavarzinia sp. CC-PAN008 TaxID=3243332 RepID=UPI003F74AA07